MVAAKNTDRRTDSYVKYIVNISPYPLADLYPAFGVIPQAKPRTKRSKHGYRCRREKDLDEKGL